MGCEHITEKGQHPKGVDKRRRHHQERVVAEVMRTRKDNMGSKGVEKSGEDSQRQVIKILRDLRLTNHYSAWYF